MIKSFLIGICFFVSLIGSSQELWSLKKDANGIQIYTRPTASNNFNEFKAVTTLDSQLDVVLKALLEAPKYHKNNTPGVSYYVKSKENNQHIFYAKKALPWPIKDRDIVTLLTVERLSDKKVKLVLEGLPQELPEKNETIRIKNVMGYWLLEEKEDKTMVTQQLLIDPEGSLPPFIVNALLVKGPYSTFKALHKVAKNSKANTLPS